jgi:hypothetical protein
VAKEHRFVAWLLPHKRNFKPCRQHFGLGGSLGILSLLVAVEQNEFLGEGSTPPPEMFDPARSFLYAIQRISRRCEVYDLQMNAQSSLIGKACEKGAIARLRLPFAAEKNRPLGLDKMATPIAHPICGTAP